MKRHLRTNAESASSIAFSPIPATGVLAGLGITTTSALGAVAIALIGLANVGGTLAAGALGQRYQKKYLLAQIYLGRTVVAANDTKRVKAMLNG